MSTQYALYLRHRNVLSRQLSVAQLQIDLSFHVQVTWFFSLGKIITNEGSVRICSLLRKYALMVSGIFPSMSVRGLGSVCGIHFLSKVARCVCLLWTAPPQTAADLTCPQVADVHQPCTAVLHYLKSCFRVVSAGLYCAEGDVTVLPWSSPAQLHLCCYHSPVRTTVQIPF